MTRTALSSARRIVVKVGSALLRADSAVISAIASEIAALMGAGVDVILVSSGAVAMGRSRLGLADGHLTLEQKQAAAAAGQPVLVNAWEAAFAAHDRSTAQALITLDVTESRRRWLNARATLNTLLEYGLVPIVNENDTVATDEIRYGDNDRLAARVAQLAGADLLVLLSDVDGVYTADPRHDPAARKLDSITEITPDIHALAGEANSAAGVGTGGMRTKILAAEMAAQSGCGTLIGRGSAQGPLTQFDQDQAGTYIQPAQSASKAREAWIAGSLSPNGQIHIDAGAAKALRAGKSLLPVGVTRIAGQFERGDTVSIIDADGAVLARGVSAYDVQDAHRIQGCQTDAIESILGFRRAAALVHADDIVLSQPAGTG